MQAPCPDAESLQAGCDDILRQARRTVDILAPDLDPFVLDREPPLDALAQLTRVSRFTRIRVLFHDAGSAVRDGHRLIHVARRFPSFISMRRVAEEHREESASWIVVDSRHALWRPDFTVKEGGHLFHEEPGKATQLVRRFNRWWEYSAADPALRELHL